jgi:hypothetical protein
MPSQLVLIPKRREVRLEAPTERRIADALDAYSPSTPFETMFFMISLVPP